jgi:hypothetical protein
MSEHTNVAVDGVDDAGPADIVDDDLPSLLRRREHARPNRVTWILLALLLVSAGFVGGAYVNERFGASASGLPSGFPAGLPDGGIPTGLPDGASPAQGTGTAFGDMTVGTVKLVDKQSVYITTPDGATVKVSVPDTATVTAEQDVDLADLEAGSTVIIRGTTAADGTVTATSVSEGSLPGVPAPTTQGEN